MSDRWALLGVFLLSVVIPSTGTAHSFRPAELEVRASGDGTYRVRWTVPAAPGASRVPADRMDAFQPRFPDTCDRSDHTRRRSRGRTRTATWRLDCPRGALVEGTVGFPAFPTGLSSVLVGFTDAEGNREATVASPHRPEVALPGAQRDDSRAATAGTSPTTTLRTVRRYVRIGVIHILKGTDHLLFILCLLLLLEGLGRIAVTLTAFTAAHSLTLAAATLGWVDVPGRAVETIIALSIVLLAVEVVHRHRGRHTLASRYPWGVAFAFGLLHGLGFAGALASVGLPAEALPTALFGFNVGVELGQLLFVLLTLGIWRGVRAVTRRMPSMDRALASPLVPVAAAYVVGTLASFWSIRRAAGIFGLVAVLGLTGCVGGEETREPPPDAGSKTDAAAEGSTVDYTEDRPRCAVRDPHRNAYFGDLHVHTALSFDAYNPGNRIDPEGAYRFAKGEPIERPTPGNVDNPERIQLDRPLDFAAVTDHAEYLGEVALCRDSGSAVYDTDVCRSLRAKSSESSSGLQGFFTRLADPQPARPDRLCGDERCANASRSVWNRIQRAAERAYDRTESCSFTSFVGYEYTNTRLGNNLHRNVIFRNADVPDEVVSMFEEPKPAGLWRRLRDSCLRADSECDVLTIPHNSNLSSGAMFTRRYPGADSVAEQRQRARLRSRLEPLMEIYQHKGSMECTNGIDGVLGTPDEFCDFEKAYPKDADNCGGEIGRFGLLGLGCVSTRNFYRNILAMGLEEKQRLGVDPFRLGVVAGTDTHLSTPGQVDEADWSGHATGNTSPRARLTGDGDRNIPASRSPGGLTGVWAVENSRDAIFEALRRQETFATSGPRIPVRLFGGWNLPDEMCDQPGFAESGYERGVPMGGELTARESNQGGPTFAVLAHRDAGLEGPARVPLDQIQIVEGTVPPDGEPTVEVHTVAGEPDDQASVDLQTCETSGGGFDTLCAVWTDPSFNPRARSFYYARVLQTPTCRWSTYQCNSLPADERPDSCSSSAVPDTIRERAWTSPIWVEPRDGAER